MKTAISKKLYHIVLHLNHVTIWEEIQLSLNNTNMKAYKKAKSSVSGQTETVEVNKYK